MGRAVPGLAFQVCIIRYTGGWHLFLIQGNTSLKCGLVPWEILNSEALFHVDLQTELCISSLQWSYKSQLNLAMPQKHLEVVEKPFFLRCTALRLNFHHVIWIGYTLIFLTLSFLYNGLTVSSQRCCKESISHNELLRHTHHF